MYFIFPPGKTDKPMRAETKPNPPFCCWPGVESDTQVFLDEYAYGMSG